MKTYDVLSFDVWGNARDGYDTNDVYRVGRVRLPDDASRRQVIAALRAAVGITMKRLPRWLGIEETDTGWMLTDERRPRIPTDPDRDPPAYGWGHPLWEIRQMAE